MKSVSEDMEILDWFLSSEPVGTLLNWPVGAHKLADSIRQIHLESKRDGADPEVIRRGWDGLSAAIGPMLICHLLGSPDWRELVPSVQGEGKGWVNVWSGDTHRVVASLVYSDGVPINVEFQVRTKE